MKINDLLGEFYIFMSNEESKLYDSINESRPYNEFSEREQVLLDSLIRKSLIKRYRKDCEFYVRKNQNL